jgi:hypothetical protein
LRLDLDDWIWAKEPNCPADAHPACLAVMLLVDRGLTGDGAIGAPRRCAGQVGAG